jgi:hypothetical protein
MKDFQKGSWFCLLLILSCLQLKTFSQDKKGSLSQINTRITMSYLNTSNDSVVLTANLYVSRDEGPFALQNATIELSATDGKESKLLGKIKTDEQGNAVFKIHINSGVPADKEGKTVYSVKFDGTKNYLPSSESITTKPAKIMVTFSKEDSLKYIKVSAKQVESNGAIKPVTKEKVIVYIPRLFSLLKIGEIDLDENGEGRVVCPEKFVGDSLGNIMFIARIEESDTYGNVQGQSSITWGIPKQYYLAEKPTRELWTPVAPIWMIVTLIIMLTGVWAHYLYAVGQLIKIKFTRKKDIF